MQPNESQGWEYHPDDQEPSDSAQPEDSQQVDDVQQKTQVSAGSEGVVWTADEYIHHDRGLSWFLALFVAAIALSGFLYAITKDVATSVVIIVLAGIVGAFASRKPAEIEYRVSTEGIDIGAKHYPFNLFKSFSIIQDKGLKSIFLTPLKKLMPPISMYYSPQDEIKIIEIIGNYLPEEQRKTEAVERLARRLRF